ncbi:hypothetical protein ACFV2N_36925 [Streptomyces sp. NPDC059680]|uniref:hypothetical protein n=1 Tax=Streptomyces sp. NPDC059680 TaxID=3346904 RepID=UPI0036CC3D31
MGSSADGVEFAHTMDLAAALGVLVTERAWELPVAGVTLRKLWATIVPELVGHGNTS